MVIGFDASRAFGAERGGTENYSLQLLRALVKVDRNNKYVVYTRRLKGQTQQGVQSSNVGDYSFKGQTLRGELEEFRKRPNVWVKEIGWPRLWTQGGLAIATWRDGMDLLFVPAHTLPVLRRGFGGFGGRLVTVVTIHGLEYEYLPEHYKIPQKYYLTWSTRYAASRATRLVAVSSFTKQELVERLGVGPAKVDVVHEGVDEARFQKSYKEREVHSVLESLELKKPYVLFVGVVQPRKNLVRLIEAFAQLTRTGLVTPEQKNRKNRITRPVLVEDVFLVIAGRLGWMYEEVLAAPKRFGVEGRVKFVGYVDDDVLPILYKEAAVYVQPSLTEGYGLPVLEAMAAGVPVVAAKAGALPEVVVDAGLLVNPTSIEDFSKAMRMVLTHPELAEGLREKGLRRVKEFSWERCAREMLKVFGEVTKNPVEPLSSYAASNKTSFV